MATKYLYHGGNNTTGDSWATAYTTFAGALAALSGESTLLVASDHAETMGAGYYARFTTTDVISTDRGTGAYVKAAASNFTITTATQFTGNLNFFGIWIQGNYLVTLNYGTYEDCTLVCRSMRGSSSGIIGSAIKRCSITLTTSSDYPITCYTDNIFDGCVFNISGTNPGYIVNAGGTSIFRNCTFTISSSFTYFLNSIYLVTFIGCTFPVGTAFGATPYKLVNCKIGTDTGVCGAGQLNAGNASRSTTTYSSNAFRDNVSSNYISEVLSHVSSTFATPSSTISSYIKDTGTKTIKIPVNENYTDPLTLDDLWMELSLPDGTTGVTKTVTTRVPLSVTALTTSGITWTNPPAGGRQAELSWTGSIQQVGPVVATVYLHKFESGKVVHLNPLLEIT